MITGFSFLIALVMFASAPQAKAAEYPNILVGNNLTLGTSNQGVVVLQGLLSELGYLQVPTGVPFGYYGTLTKNAVAAYQMSRGVTPTSGYFGPLTKIAMHSDFASHGWLSVLGW